MRFRTALLTAAAFLTWAGITPAAAQLTRPQVQHMLRRMAFSAPPATVVSVLNTGIDPWMASQRNWTALNDANSTLEQPPTSLVDGGYADGNVFERIVYQHMILTPRQLQAKMELHWLDHFAIGLETVGDPALMYHYDQTVQANALGNFATLLAAVSQEPAMLIWLSNNYNYGSTPNENFAREVQQLYSTGLYQLNDDGSLIINSTTKLPEPTYAQPDVVGLARAMTGYGVVYDSNNTNPETRFSVQYNSGGHYSGAIKYWGKTQAVPTDGTAITYVANQLALRPSTAPFIVTELLQRFVTQNPPPDYIARVVAVWRAAQKAPDQLAQVMQAIVDDPDFATAYRSMPKQPAEFTFDLLRVLPGQLQAAADASPGDSLLYELSTLGQQLFYSPTVFSFYRPGNIGTTITTGSLLARTGVVANIVNAQQSGAYTDTYISIPTLRAAIGSTSGSDIAGYLLDAMVDGGSPSLQSKLQAFLGKTPDDNQILGAIWLIANAADYSVN